MIVTHARRTLRGYVYEFYGWNEFNRAEYTHTLRLPRSAPYSVRFKALRAVGRALRAAGC